MAVVIDLNQLYTRRPLDNFSILALAYVTRLLIGGLLGLRLLSKMDFQADDSRYGQNIIITSVSRSITRMLNHGKLTCEDICKMAKSEYMRKDWSLQCQVCGSVSMRNIMIHSMTCTTRHNNHSNMTSSNSNITGTTSNEGRECLMSFQVYRTTIARMPC